MKTTKEICSGLRRRPSLSACIPLAYSRSVPVPGVLAGRRVLAFYFYKAEGPAHMPKEIHAPAARVLIDMESGELAELTLAPALWLPGHSVATVLGSYPPAALSAAGISAADGLYEAYYLLTDRVLAEFQTCGDYDRATVLAEWKASFTKVHEAGLMPYFLKVPGFPISGGVVAGEDCAPPTVAPALDGPVAVEPKTEDLNLIQGRAARLVKILDELRLFLRSNHQATLLPRWQKISRLLDQSVFVVAVAGEFSRGKSSLINRLLDESLLPEGDLPTTTMLTKISAGAERRAICIAPDGARSSMPLTREALEEFSATNIKGDRPGVLELELPHPWLQAQQLAFIDTPGAGDLTDARAALACEALANCEAAIVAVSALSPLSLTEKAFVEEHIFNRRVPRVAIIITRLDQLKAGEAEGVMRYVVDKIKAWNLSAEVWSTTDVAMDEGASSVAVTGPEKIRAALAAWANDPSRTRRRLEQLCWQAAELMLLARAAILAATQVANLEASTRKETIQKARTQLETERLRWEDLRLEFERRCDQTTTWFQEMVNEAARNLIQRYVLEVNRLPNPKEWWAKELPYRLMQDLRGLSRSFSGPLADRLNRDGQWLFDSARRVFSVELPGGASVPVIELGQEAVLANQPNLPDLNRYRYTTRIVSIAVGAGGFLCFGPLGALISGLGGLAAEKALNQKLQEQRLEVARLLGERLEKLLFDASNECRPRIRQAYATVLSQTRERETAWHRERLAAIKLAAGSSGFPPETAGKSLAQIDQLLKEIRNIEQEFTS